MGFTTGIVIKLLDRGVLVEDCYNTFIRVLWDDVVLEDREALVEGVKVIISDEGVLEIATSSFNRFRDDRELEEEEIANEKTFIIDTGE